MMSIVTPFYYFCTSLISKTMRTIVLTLFVSVFLFSCSSLKTTSQFDEEQDFAKYKKFSFMGWTSDTRSMTKDDKSIIEQSVKKELEKRGMVFSQFGGDVTISLFIIIDQGTQQSAYMDHYQPYGGYSYNVPWAYFYGYGKPTQRQHTYETGTIIIDMFDETSKKLTWQGIVKGKVNENPEARQYGIPKAIEAVFKDYPVKAQ